MCIYVLIAASMNGVKAGNLRDKCLEYSPTLNVVSAPCKHDVY